MWNKRFQAALIGFALILPVLNAQDAPSQKPTINRDFSNDPCGNPLTESQLWMVLEGTVVNVVDGRTVIVSLDKSRRTMRVQLPGLNLPSVSEYREKALMRVQKLLLNSRVQVLVNQTAWEKPPKQVTAIVSPAKGTEDIGLLLLNDGLASFTVPPPYTMSRYSECQYKNAERDAKTHGAGLWTTAKLRID